MVALAQKYSNDSSTTQSQQQLLQNWHSYEIKAVILAYFLLLLKRPENICSTQKPQKTLNLKNGQFFSSTRKSNFHVM